MCISKQGRIFVMNRNNAIGYLKWKVNNNTVIRILGTDHIDRIKH